LADLSVSYNPLTIQFIAQVLVLNNKDRYFRFKGLGHDLPGAIANKLGDGIAYKDIWISSSTTLSLLMVGVSFPIVGRLIASKTINRGRHHLPS
jgi:hypothetical protein